MDKIKKEIKDFETEMSEQALKEFMAKVAQDEELARKVQGVGTDDD